MISVICKHCDLAHTFENRDQAIDRGWRYAKAGTDQTPTREAWFCPLAPSSAIGAFLEAQGIGVGSTEGRIRE
jgi:hypothetical protein